MANILLIEPNHILARMYIEALSQSGYIINHAVTAQDAIRAADTQQPDIVILELQLAGHDGIEFLHEFRSYHDWMHIPVIINSYVSTTTLISAQEVLKRDLGVDICLYKPRTSLEQLVSVVRRKITIS